ncbi:MAG: transposase [Anaerolineae bacterium]|nr:transposase [Anaerolineae bacterium]
MGWEVAIGIDVSKRTLDVVLLRGNDALHAQFDNTPAGFIQLGTWLRRRQAVAIPVCLEATGVYSEAVAVFLHEAGYEVSVVNPARTKAYADSRLNRQKTDKTDALVIAQFCQTQQPARWQPPDPAQRELQALVRQLCALQGMYRQEQNRLEASRTSEAVSTMLCQHLAFLEQQMEEMQHLIRNLIECHPDLKRQHDLLDTIPGLGETTIATLLAEIPDIRAFDTAPQLAAYAGVTPRHYRSGTSVHGRTRMSKRGNALLRVALYFPAMVALRHNPIIRAFGERLKASGHAPKSIIGAAMRKLLHLVFGVLKSGRPFDPAYSSQVVA